MLTEPLYSNANDRSTESELDRNRLGERKRVPARAADYPVEELNFVLEKFNYLHTWHYEPSTLRV